MALGESLARTRKTKDMEYAVECTGLEKRYGDFVLGPLSLTVERGTVVGLIGQNGAGKTTLIKLLLGLVGADGGQIGLFGQRVPNPENLPADTKARIGVVLDTCSFTQTMKVDDVEALGRAAYKEWDGRLFGELADAFGLDPKKTVEKLSRGMGMKLSMAFALAHHPELLVLDEATAGLDPMARDEVLDILRDFMLDESHAILISSHITSDLEKIADKIVLIDGGQVLLSEQKDALCDAAGIAHCRAGQLEEVLELGLVDRERVRVLRHGYGVDLLVPDRFAFARAFPDAPVDRATIEDYMNMMLKGEPL